MTPKLILAIALILTSAIAQAQLKGSGKTITKNYNYQNFDKISFNNLDGNIEVEVGKPWSISVTIDDNLFPLLSFDEKNSDNSLEIYFKGNVNNRMYIEDANLKIRITMPAVSVILHNGNSVLEVNGVFGKYLKLENKSNATTKISGFVEKLDVVNSGNGNSKLENLISKYAQLVSRGNGTIYVNVSDTIIAKTSGNSCVINEGNAVFGDDSSKSGNSSFINK